MTEDIHKAELVIEASESSLREATAHIERATEKKRNPRSPKSYMARPSLPTRRPPELAGSVRRSRACSVVSPPSWAVLSYQLLRTSLGGIYFGESEARRSASLFRAARTCPSPETASCGNSLSASWEPCPARILQSARVPLSFGSNRNTCTALMPIVAPRPRDLPRGVDDLQGRGQRCHAGLPVNYIWL